MQQHPQPGTWFVRILIAGVIASLGFVAFSWLDHLFYVMGPPPGNAAHAAFRSDCITALWILAGSAFLGQIATLLASALQAKPNSEAARWSELHRAASRGQSVS